MLKQYLVVKVPKQIESLAQMVPLAGLFARDAAEQFVMMARQAEPEFNFLIQEVGTA